MQAEGSVTAVFSGASGLGEATARRLAADGAEVLVADRNAEPAAAVAGDAPRLAEGGRRGDDAAQA